MKFVNDFETGKRVIQERFPEFTGRSLRGDDSGWDNFAITVDGEYLFRFPRREDARAQIRREVEVLNVLRSKLPSNIRVPEYLATELDKDYPFVYYKMIEGEPLTEKLYAGLDDAKKKRLAENVATFLDILHRIDVESCRSLEHIDAMAKYQDFYRQITEKCFGYLTPDEQKKTEQLFARYFQDPRMREYAPTVVHGDLSGNHILATEDGIGVIDFGDVSVFDPAIDVSWFYLLDKSLLHSVLEDYSAHKDDGFMQRISKFYVPIIPYYGVIYGDEIGDKKLVESELKDLQENLARVENGSRN